MIDTISKKVSLVVYCSHETTLIIHLQSGQKTTHLLFLKKNVVQRVSIKLALSDLSVTYRT